MNNYMTCRMNESDIAEAVNIWVDQYKQYCSSSESFPCNWSKNTSELEGFLKGKINDKTAIIVKRNKKLVGYMTFDEFPFNGEKSVFCPAIAHAAVDEYKEEAYLSLYKHISKEWVGRNVFNHMWTIFYNDLKLRDILYDLGFGSYLVDAFTFTNNKMVTNLAYKIRKAEIQDIEILNNLVEESRGYYSFAPLFLRREQYSCNDLLEIIQENNVFIAWEDNQAIGFIHMSISRKDNIIDLSEKHSGLIDEIGAYIKSEYRGMGLGKELLRHVFDYCSINGIENIHVDYETANLFANRFWKKYFDPMLLSVRRTINKNINNDGINNPLT